MNIKDVADISRLPAKTIRYHEDIGLVRPERAGNGYRRFAPRPAIRDGEAEAARTADRADAFA